MAKKTSTIKTIEVPVLKHAANYPAQAKALARDLAGNAKRARGGKKTSRRMAAIAARVMNGGDWSTKDVKALAACVLAQVESEKSAAEQAKERCS